MCALKYFTFKDVWFKNPLGIPRGFQKAASPHLGHLSAGQGITGFVFDNVVIGDKKVNSLTMDVQGRDIPNSPVIVKDERYRVDVQSEAALAFVKRHATGDNPFFLYYAPSAPHVPLTAPQVYQAPQRVFCSFL